MLEINIAEYLIGHSLVKAHDNYTPKPILAELKVGSYFSNETDKTTDFSHIDVTATFEILHDKIPQLLTKILENDKLHLTTEGGHSKARVLHSGDSTGKE